MVNIPLQQLKQLGIPVQGHDLGAFWEYRPDSVQSVQNLGGMAMTLTNASSPSVSYMASQVR